MKHVFSVAALVFLCLPAAFCQPPPVFLSPLDAPFFCAFDRHGALLVAESGAHAVRKFDPKTGRLTTVADGLGEPVALALDDKTGDLYVVDHARGEVVKRDGKTGKVTTLAGKADGLREPHDCALDRHGGLLVADVAAGKLWRLELKTGEMTVWRDGFRGPRALAVGRRDGTVYVCEREGNQVQRIDGKTGVMTRLAGTGAKGYDGDGGPARAATFNGPKGLGLDARENVYVVDTENNAIRRIDGKTHIITTVASGLKRPHGVTIGPDGVLYIADTENNCVRRVRPPEAGVPARR